MVMVKILQQTHINIHECKNNKKIILETYLQNDLCMVQFDQLPCLSPRPPPPRPPPISILCSWWSIPDPRYINAERDNSPPRAPDRPHKTCFGGTSFCEQN